MEKMVKVIKIEPKDVYVTFEIGFDDLKKVVSALQVAEVNMDSKNDPESVIAAHYLIKEFFPVMAEVVHDLEREREMGHGA
jgi:hypothetical protein